MRNGSKERPHRWLRKAVHAFRNFTYVQPPRRQPPRPAGRRPKIGLALGGGFARGIAHLGVLRALEQRHIPIDFIAGTSAGALAGVAYTSALPFDKVVTEASAIRFGNFGQWRFSRMGLASNRRLADYPHEHLGVENFSDLRIPLAIVATDLVSGEAVYFTKGPLGPPLCASCAYPGLFRPVEYEGRLLVDGFIAAALPIDGLRKMGADIVIAVQLEAEMVERPANVVDVIGRSFSIVRLQADKATQIKAEVIIRPKVHEFAWDDFARTSEMVTAGEVAALAVVPHITTLLRSYELGIAPEAVPSAKAG